MELLAELLQCATPAEGRLIVRIVRGELRSEILDRRSGEKMIADKEIIDFCLVGEPTSSKKVADCARIGRRGSLGGHLKIFGKQGQACINCGSIIKKIKIAGRGTHICTTCQKTHRPRK